MSDTSWYCSVEPEISAYFKTFVEMHCCFEKGAWIHIEMLHVAFLDFVADCTSVEWVNKNISRHKLKTLNLALSHGAIQKGTPACIILANMKLVSYP